MTDIEQYQPTKGIVEKELLEHIKKTFKRWEEYYETKITLGTREIAKLQDRLIGAKLNARYGFEAVMQRNRDNEEKGEYLTLVIYRSKEAVETEEPLYFFTTKIYE